MAFLLFLPLGLKELAARPDLVGTGAALHLFEQLRGSLEQTGLHQTGGDGDVLLRRGDAFFEGAHAVTDFYT